MGDLLQKAMEGISGAMAPDPNNPFPVPPPSFIEYPLAFLGGLGQHPRAGPVTRGLSALSGFAGQEMGRRRADPMGRILPVAQEVVQGLRDVTLPGQTLQVGGPVPATPPPGLLQGRPPTEFPEEPPTFDLPGQKATSIEQARQYLSPALGQKFAALQLAAPQTLQHAFPKEEEFSLGRGQQRFRGKQVVASGLPEPPDLNIETRYEAGPDGKPKSQAYQVRVIYDPNTKLPTGEEQRIIGSEHPAQPIPQRAPQTANEIELEKAQLRAAKTIEEIRRRELKGEIDTPREINAVLTNLNAQLRDMDQSSPEAAEIKNYIVGLNRKLMGQPQPKPGQEPKTWEDYRRLRQGTKMGDIR